MRNGVTGSMVTVMTDGSPLQLIARVRRAQPRNEDVLAICKLLEERIVRPVKMKERTPLTRAEIQKNYRQRKKAKGK